MTNGSQRNCARGVEADFELAPFFVVVCPGAVGVFVDCHKRPSAAALCTTRLLPLSSREGRPDDQDGAHRHEEKGDRADVVDEQRGRVAARPALTAGRRASGCRDRHESHEPEQDDDRQGRAPRTLAVCAGH
jgi:hypothetical protein